MTVKSAAEWVHEEGGMDTADNIERFIQIEEEAFHVIQEAEDKASQLLLEVRTQSEQIERQKVAEARKKLDAEYAVFVDSLAQQSRKVIEEFRVQLGSLPLDAQALAARLELILSPEA